MLRRFLVFFSALAVALCSQGLLWAARSELLPETMLMRSGLVRPWFAQVELDQGRSRVTHVTLSEGVLYVQTDSAMVHAIDAETGRSLWSKRVGLSNRPSMRLDAKGELVAVVNGSRLYLLDCKHGDLLDERDVRDAPGAGPALSSKWTYVPGVKGAMAAYHLPRAANSKREAAKTEKGPDAAGKTPAQAARQPDASGKAVEPPLFCQSFGRAMVQPLVTRDYVGGEYVVWPTDRGYLNFGRVERSSDNALSLKYRLETGATIVARPGYLPPDPKVLGEAGTVFAASRDGFLYAVQEETGETLWRFSTGEPIRLSPAVIDDRVYLTTELGGMYCLAAKSGKSLWWAEDIMQFVAASKTRVYAIDRIGRLLVLQAASGARIDAIPVEDAAVKLANTDTDRIYLVSDGGLVQCLREVEQIEPIIHGKERKEAAKAEAERPAEQKPAQPKKAGEGEKPVKKERAAPKPPTTPKERPAPKDRVKKDVKKAVKKAVGGAAAGANDNPFDTGPGNGAKTPPKAKKPADANPF